MTEEVKEKAPTKLPKWLIIVIVIVGLIFAGISASGYFAAKIASKVVKTAIEQKTGAKIDVNKDGSSVKVKSEDGSLEIGTNTKWPDDTPAGIPKFSSGAIQGVVKTDKSWTIMIKDVEESAAKSYVSQLKSLGWTVLVESTSSSVSVTQMEKDNLQISLTYESSSKNMNLMIAYKE